MHFPVALSRQTYAVVMTTGDREADLRARETERLVEEIRAATVRGPDPYAWWEHPSDILGGRTPTEAMEDDDEAAVRDLIAYWYRRSEEAAERLRNDPVAMERIERKSAELRAARSA